MLIWEILGLLIGEGVDTDTAYAVRDIVENDAVGAKSGLPSTMCPGPEEVPMTLAVEFKKNMLGEQTFESMRRIESAIRTRFRRVKLIYIESNPRKCRHRRSNLENRIATVS